MIKHNCDDSWFRGILNGKTSLCKLCSHIAWEGCETWGLQYCDIHGDAYNAGETLFETVEYEVDDISENSEQWHYISKCNHFMLSKEKYKKYLNLESWKKFAKEIKLSKGCKCELCGSEWNLDVHHLNYDCLFKETEYDVVCTCRKCHKKIHKA